MLEGAPWLFRAARRLPRSYIAQRYMRRWGLLDQVAYFRFYEKRVAVPLDEYDAWHFLKLSDYQARRIGGFAKIADTLMDSFDFVDCGAHLGLFSAQFSMLSRNCHSITAIEPNERMARLAEINIRAGRLDDVSVIHAAVADFCGKGRLVAPDYDLSSQALYLQADPEGDIDVVRLDSVAERIGPSLAIKLDIEGAELAVLQSARDFIRSRRNFAICIELHRGVLSRVGMSDIELLAAINEIRPLTWFDAENPGVALDPMKSLWEQTGKPRQCDLIGVAAPR